jgi:hypothetical protein
LTDTHADRIGADAPPLPTTRVGSSLTPALNALGRWRSLACVAAIVLAGLWLTLATLFGVVPVGPGLTNRLGGVAPGDFMFFYPAGVLAGRGDAAAVYEPAALTNAAKGVFGPRVPELVWAYPPTMSLPLAVLGQFPPGPALLLWIAVALISLTAIARVVLGTWRAAPWCLLFPGSALALFTGQFSPTLALGLAAFFALGATRPWVGGAALGLFVCKPHFGVAAAAIALFERRWRLVIGAVAASVALALASVIAFGGETWIAFVSAAGRHSGLITTEVPLARLVSVFGAGVTAGIGVWPSLVLHAVAAAIAAVAGIRFWTRDEPPPLRALGLCAATLLIPPYALDYDLVFLLVPWLLMIGEARHNPARARALFWPWIGLTLLVPVSYLTQLYTGQSVAGPLLMAIVALCWRSNPGKHLT